MNTSREQIEFSQEEILDWLDAPLTPAEERVLTEMVTGDSNRAIAAELRVDESTVKCHVHTILRKLRAESRGQAVYYGLLLGVTTIGRRGPMLAKLRSRFAQSRTQRHEGVKP